MKYIFEEKQNEKRGKYAVIKGCEVKSSTFIIPSGVEKNPEGDDADTSNKESLPVKEIGNHAFSSRKDLLEVSIPESVDTILGFAFHNCSNLRKISLYDSVGEYLDGGTRQCENLEEIEVTINQGNYYIVRRILEDNDRRLAFNLHMPEGDALLVFPGFNYDFVENTMARTIQFAIEGTGYAYRECVKQAEINYREYDGFFRKASADDRVTAEMIAIARLLYPYELSEEAKNAYTDWLLENAKDNLTRAVKLLHSDKRQKNRDGRVVLDKIFGDIESHVAFYLERELLRTEDSDDLVHLAADKGITTIVSMLMDYAKCDRNLQKQCDTGVTNASDKDVGITFELDF